MQLPIGPPITRSIINRLRVLPRRHILSKVACLSVTPCGGSSGERLKSRMN